MTAPRPEVTAILDDKLGLTVTALRGMEMHNARAQVDAHVGLHPDAARWHQSLLEELDVRITIAAGGGNGADVRTENFVVVDPPKRVLVQAPDFPEGAMPGPWGRLIKETASYTEAHPASIILPALVMCGVSGGEGVRLGSQRPIEYVAILGPSSIGRKDTGLEIALDLATMMRLLRPKLGQPNSGEGVWWAMRDPSSGDPGAEDYRMCLVDTEMSGTLAAAHRTGSTVMQALLSMYDRGTKSALTKRDPVSVSRGHFGYIGLGVPQIIARHMTFEDREAGLAPRLLIALVERVRTIPPSRAIELARNEELLAGIATEIRDRMDFAVSAGRRWSFSDGARELLDSVAATLVDPDRPETARALAHVTRLAMHYHLTVPPPDASEPDQPGVIATSHLKAAIAAYTYCDESARRLYAGDDLLDRLMMFAADKPEGLSRTELFRLLGNNVSAAELGDAIVRGHAQGRLNVVEVRGNVGRPTQRIIAK